MMIYKFLPAEYATAALDQGRLKVSELSGLNDIYDCAPLIGPELPFLAYQYLDGPRK